MTAFTGSDTPTSATTEVIGGEVNPGGQAVTYYVTYDEASKCEASKLSDSTPAQTLPFTDTTGHEVSVTITGLTPGTDYCAEVVASNGSTTTYWEQRDEFVAGVPSVYTFPLAYPRTPTTATLTGRINPAGQTTTYHFAYAPYTGTECPHFASDTLAQSTPTETLPFTDATEHEVSAELTGLTPEGAYCDELLATNGSGLGVGNEFDELDGVVFPYLPEPQVAPTPSAPTALSAVPSNGGVQVSWQPPASAGSSPITGYVVTVTPAGTDRVGGPLAGAKSATVAPSALKWSLPTGLVMDCHQRYAVTVAAENGAGLGPAADSAVFRPSGSVARGKPPYVVILLDGIGESKPGFTMDPYSPTRTGPASYCPENIDDTGAPVANAFKATPSVINMLRRDTFCGIAGS